MKGTAFVFINNIQAARFGHVGWGFALDDQESEFYFGSTDHLYRHPWWDLPGWIAYAHLKPEMDIDWWSQTGTRQEMFNIMHRGQKGHYHIRYHKVKALPVMLADGKRAVEVAEEIKRGGWSVVSNNCVHQTFRVLTAYGAVLPQPASPVTNLIPKVWFSAIAGEQTILT